MIAYHLCWDLVYLGACRGLVQQLLGVYLAAEHLLYLHSALRVLLSGQPPPYPPGSDQLLRRCRRVSGNSSGNAGGADPVRRADFFRTAALLTVPLRPLLARIPPRLGLILSFSLFLLARDVNHGYLGFAWVPLLRLPRGLYSNLATAGLGFPAPAFASSDYFALLPWLFLFWTGFYLYRLRPEIPALPDIRLPGLSVMSRHSLLLYLLHQPVLYAALVLLPTIL